MGRRIQPRPRARWSLNDLVGSSWRRLATVALVLLSASIAVNFGELIVRGAEIQEKIARQREVNAATRAETERLGAQLSFYESDVHVEMVAREQLGYAREGDTVILPSIAIVEPTPVPAQAAPLPAAKPPANWLGWWHAFFPAPDE